MENCELYCRFVTMVSPSLEKDYFLLWWSSGSPANLITRLWKHFFSVAGDTILVVYSFKTRFS